MEDDGTQNYLVFQPTQRYFKAVCNANNHILSRKSRGLLDGSIKPPSASANIIKSMLNYVGSKIRVEFKGSCIKQAKISFNHGKIINIYIVYEMNKSFNISSSYLTLENCPENWSSSHIVNKKKYILILGCTEEKNGSKYFTLVSTVKTIEVLIKYKELWDNIKNLTKATQGDEACDYGKDFMEIKFN